MGPGCVHIAPTDIQTVAATSTDTDSNNSAIARASAGARTFAHAHARHVQLTRVLHRSYVWQL